MPSASCITRGAAPATPPTNTALTATLPDPEFCGMPLSLPPERRPQKNPHAPKRAMLGGETVPAGVRRLRGLFGCPPDAASFASRASESALSAFSACSGGAGMSAEQKDWRRGAGRAKPAAAAAHFPTACTLEGCDSAPQPQLERRPRDLLGQEHDLSPHAAASFA